MKALIIPVLFAPFISGASTVPVTLYTSQVGPYAELCDDSTMTVLVTSKNTTTYRVYEVVMFGTTEQQNIYSTKTAVHDAIYHGHNSSTITVPTSALMTENGMKVTIKVYASDKTLYFTKSFVIYPNTAVSVNPTQVDQYSTSYIAASISNSNIIRYQETFAFYDFTKYFETLIYHHLPIEQFKFTYSRDVELTFGESFLYIERYQDYFPALTYTSGRAKIPIKIVKNGDYYQIDFNTQLYVDKKTLDMSITPKDGFVTTNYFYMPINKKKDLLGLPIRFTVKGLGMCGLTLSWTTQSAMNYNYIGNCQTSEYCVVGDVKE